MSVSHTIYDLMLTSAGTHEELQCGSENLAAITDMITANCSSNNHN